MQVMNAQMKFMSGISEPSKNRAWWVDNIIPMGVVGTVWHVFDITEEGIKSVNEFYNATSATEVK